MADRYVARRIRNYTQLEYRAYFSRVIFRSDQQRRIGNYIFEIPFVKMRILVELGNEDLTQQEDSIRRKLP